MAKKLTDEQAYELAAEIALKPDSHEVSSDTIWFTSEKGVTAEYRLFALTDAKDNELWKAK